MKLWIPKVLSWVSHGMNPHSAGHLKRYAMRGRIVQCMIRCWSYGGKVGLHSLVWDLVEGDLFTTSTVHSMGNSALLRDKYKLLLPSLLIALILITVLMTMLYFSVPWAKKSPKYSRNYYYVKQNYSNFVCVWECGLGCACARVGACEFAWVCVCMRVRLWRRPLSSKLPKAGFTTFLCRFGNFQPLFHSITFCRWCHLGSEVCFCFLAVYLADINIVKAVCYSVYCYVSYIWYYVSISS